MVNEETKKENMNCIHYRRACNGRTQNGDWYFDILGSGEISKKDQIEPQKLNDGLGTVTGTEGYNVSKTKEKKGEQRIDSPLPRLLTLKQAYAYLGLTVWALRERIWGGQIPVLQFPGGRKQYLDRNDLEGFIQRNKRTIV